MAEPKKMPTAEQFFYYFFFAAFCGIFVHQRLYGAAAFVALAALAVKDGW